MALFDAYLKLCYTRTSWSYILRLIFRHGIHFPIIIPPPASAISCNTQCSRFMQYVSEHFVQLKVAFFLIFKNATLPRNSFSIYARIFTKLFFFTYIYSLNIKLLEAYKIMIGHGQWKSYSHSTIPSMMLATGSFLLQSRCFSWIFLVRNAISYIA